MPSEADVFFEIVYEYSEADIFKAYAGNKAAIRRVRKVFLRLEKAAKAVRVELTGVRKHVDRHGK
jgi:hypothetical protein